MEPYLFIGLSIISICLIFSFYMFRKEQVYSEIKKDMKREQMPNQIEEQEVEEQEVDEKSFIRNMTEEQSLGYYSNSVYNEHEPDYEGQTTKDFLMKRCTKYWSENFPYNYQ